MGRKSGVTPEETRAQVLDAAARLFAEQGYEGASLAGIAADAGLSKGSIYGHYATKAELFFAVVREFGEREFGLIAEDPDGEWCAPVDLEDFLSRAGASYAHPNTPLAALMMEAVVASRRHDDVADLIRTWLIEGEGRMAASIELTQREGTTVPDVPAAEAARFLTMVSLGARIVGALDMPSVDEKRWVQLIDQLLDPLRSEPQTPRSSPDGSESSTP
ncbi:MAG: TetR family transcriptional regulator [Actinobacteria bacterium]|nr:TetR family transcriptional regulator [Actinomycetota bacterium]MCB9390928.1 TetR family transcriptional regulator [Acidimicrobiia bacterium]